MWIDSDTMIIDVSFLLPFQRFKGKDLVIWGNETRLALGDGRRGINSGVMLIRNSDWAKDFFEQVAELGRIAEPGLENVLMEELTSPVRLCFFLLKKFWWGQRKEEKKKEKKRKKTLTFFFRQPLQFFF